jgi:hypothetical protein
MMVAIGNAAPYQRPVNVPHICPVPAPQIDTAPTIAAVGRQVATPVSVPQVIIGIGKHLQRVPVAGPAIWALGQMVTADPLDEATGKRLRDIVGPEEAKRDAATQSNTSALAIAVHAAAFDALRLRDDWVGQDDRGTFTLSDEALHSAGLSRRDLATTAVQDALEAIGSEQVDRFNPVFNDFSGVAPFRFDQGAIRLNARFPVGLRNDVARWSTDPQFMSFFAKVWPNLRTDNANTPPRRVAASKTEFLARAKPAMVPDDPWMDAATVRQRAMADWDRVGRSGANGMTRPGRTLARPGQDAAPSTDAPRPQDRGPARAHPAMISQGNGVAG